MKRQQRGMMQYALQYPPTGMPGMRKKPTFDETTNPCMPATEPLLQQYHSSRSLHLEHIARQHAIVADVAAQSRQQAQAGPSPRREALNLLRYAVPLLWHIPIARYMRWRVRRNKKLAAVFALQNIEEVVATIEKGSFAYDRLLFNVSLVSFLKNKSHLANLVCLGILFGDEFIDGIAQTYGKEQVRHLLTRYEGKYYLHIRRHANGQLEFYYPLDVTEALPAEVLDSINPKFGISYHHFYILLLQLLEQMNEALNRLHPELRHETAAHIIRVCNQCFDTFICDIEHFNPHYSFEELLQNQHAKDSSIIYSLLCVRALLLNKNKPQYQRHYKGWTAIVHNMQLYDDMQDAAKDLDYQMNTLHYFARTCAPTEWAWLQQQQPHLLQLPRRVLHATLMLHMPVSVMLVMQLARTICQNDLSWTQHKIHNYLWLKNWYCMADTQVSLQQLLPAAARTGNTAVDVCRFIGKARNAHVTDAMLAAHITDLLLMDERERRRLMQANSLTARYFMRYCPLETPLSLKQAWLTKYIPRYLEFCG